MDAASENAVRHHPAAIRRPLSHCPGCNSTNLDPIVELDAEEVHFACADCGRCWHVELGYVRRVRPDACRCCPHRERCDEVYARDHAND